MGRPAQRTVIVDGERRLLVDICREHGIHVDTFLSRRRRGVPTREALERAVRVYRRRVDGTKIHPAMRHPLMRTAIELMQSAREVVSATETPRRRALLVEMDAWLARAGRPATPDE